MADWTAGVRRAGTLAGVALKARALRRAEDPHQAAVARRALVQALSDARGVPLKVGQFLATRDEAWRDCVDAVSPLPLEEIEPVVATALGVPLGTVFAELRPAVAAASLGQVHRARLVDGREVAVKVRYPGIAAAVEAELSLAGLLPGMGPARRWGFDLDAYKAALRDTLGRELDYRVEAAAQRRFHAGLRVDGLVVPAVVDAWCREDLLVQAWVAGAPLAEAATWPLPVRQRIAGTLMRAFLASLFVLGELHADPHPGNLGFTPEGGVLLMDYGCTTPVPERARLALLRLLLAAVEHDDTDILACFGELGFDTGRLAPIANLLPVVTRLLFEPFAERGPYPTRDWRLGERVDRALGEDKWWFRSAGPADLFLVLRCFHGLVVQLEKLGVMVDWRATLDEVVPSSMMRRAREFSPIHVPVPRAVRAVGELGTRLEVEVSEGGRVKARVGFPAELAFSLEELMPEEALAAARREGVAVADLLATVRERGLVPQDIVDLRDGDRRYRVWIA